jgi:hypothetical protein
MKKFMILVLILVAGLVGATEAKGQVVYYYNTQPYYQQPPTYPVVYGYPYYTPYSNLYYTWYWNWRIRHWRR